MGYLDAMLECFPQGEEIPKKLLHNSAEMRLAISMLKELLHQDVTNHQEWYRIRTTIALYEKHYYSSMEGLSIPEYLMQDSEKLRVAIVDLKKQLIQVSNKGLQKQIRAIVKVYENHYCLQQKSHYQASEQLCDNFHSSQSSLKESKKSLTPFSSIHPLNNTVRGHSDDPISDSTDNDSILSSDSNKTSWSSNSSNRTGYSSNNNSNNSNNNYSNDRSRTHHFTRENNSNWRSNRTSYRSNGGNRIRRLNINKKPMLTRFLQERKEINNKQQYLKLQRYVNKHKVKEEYDGITHRAFDQKNQIYVWMKQIPLDNEGILMTKKQDIAKLREMNQDITKLREINHCNIVKLLDVVNQKNTTILIFELGNWEWSLKSVMDSIQKMDLKYVKSYLRQLLEGVAHCHDRGILHLNLNPQKLLIDREGILKIADFGMNRSYLLPRENDFHHVGNVCYCAPEILLGEKKYLSSFDMWSIGCIFAEMVYHCPLFVGDSQIGQLFKIFAILGTPNESNWPGVSSFPHFKTSFPNWKSVRLSKKLSKRFQEAEFKCGLQLLEQMLVYLPNQRISAREALNYPFFNSIKHNSKKDSKKGL